MHTAANTEPATINSDARRVGGGVTNGLTWTAFRIVDNFCFTVGFYVWACANRHRAHVEATMQYLGGKARLGGRIVQAILDDIGVEHLSLVVDLCSGAGGVAHRLADVSDKVIAVEAHPGLVALHKAVQGGWMPPEYVSEEEYQEIRRGDQATALAAFVGFGCSFGGKWWGGYARTEAGNTSARNYCLNARRAVLKETRPNIDHTNADALTFEIDAAVVYCDPPYEGTTGYTAVAVAENGAWWRRLADIASPERACYLSEYAEAPPAGIEARLVWTAPTKEGLRKAGARTERLWRVLGYECQASCMEVHP